jgi:hypothetical protein
MIDIDEKEAQRRSFAYGNTHIHNIRITKELIDNEAEKLKFEKWIKNHEKTITEWTKIGKDYIAINLHDCQKTPLLVDLLHELCKTGQWEEDVSDYIIIRKISQKQEF